MIFLPKTPSSTHEKILGKPELRNIPLKTQPKDCPKLERLWRDEK
jgi:hypothetical protein